ncbi:PREDICTED: uncharacterized protein LOC109230114 [Nicotiana attenuata]|uniref:uncharacterized protein LOC109230114 n=1 Tax=Nicotiana attenuata TaxID=49451 RepID=UPI000905AF81|nr:PREDICTED: uncharacterized protein LOC109230114 [Nicotiana attenuata]
MILISTTGKRPRNADGYKLWYSGGSKDKNRVDILVDKELRETVVEVRRVSDRLMAIKLVVGGLTLNVISAYAPPAGLDEEVTRRFRRVWMRCFGFGDKNGCVTSLLDFAKAFELVIKDSSILKREEHLVTF